MSDKAKDHDNRITEAENSILLLKSLSGGHGSGEGNDGKPGIIDALETLVENLRKECDAKFGDREE